MKENYFWEGEMKTDKGEAYSVKLTSTKNGFKEFGNINSAKKKVFFLGDSYTQSVEVSNEKTFYRILQDSLDFELFAYGQALFGTTQEYLILEEFLEEINPDLVVLQLTTNDFIDNYHPLEKKCGYYVGLRRPYLDWDGTIVYIQGKNSFDKILNSSKFWNFLAKRWDNIQYKFFDKSKEIGEYYIANDGKNYQPFKEAIEITLLNFEKIKDKITAINPDINLIVFPSSNMPPYKKEYQTICDSLNIPFFDQPGTLLDSLKWRGHSVHSVDGYHWNEFGQEAVAKSLHSILKKILDSE